MRTYFVHHIWCLYDIFYIHTHIYIYVYTTLTLYIYIYVCIYPWKRADIRSPSLASETGGSEKGLSLSGRRGAHVNKTILYNIKQKAYYW